MPAPAPVEAVEAARTALDGSVAAAGGGATLVLGWFGWIVKRAFGVTIPRLSHDFKEAMEKQGDLFRAALSEQRSDFREELKQARHDFKEELKQDRLELSARLEKLSTAVERMDSTLRGLERK